MSTTNKAAHTPGPWREFSPFIFTEKPFKISQENYRTVKAGRGYYDWQDPEGGFSLSGLISPANARLIAAAPEMLDALEAALDEIHEFNLAHEYGNRPRNPELTQEAEVKIKAAIQKAKDGQ